MARQVVQVAITGGVDQGTDARLVDPSKATSIINGQYERDGVLRKRRGYTALPRTLLGGGNITSGQSIATLGSELVLFDGAYAYSYAPASSQWVKRSRTSPFGMLPRQTVALANEMSRTSATGPAQDLVSPDIALASGYYCITYQTQRRFGSGTTDTGFGIPWALIIDATSGAQLALLQLENVTNFLAPRVCALGSNFYVVYIDNAGNLWGRQIPTGTLTPSAAVKLAPNVMASNLGDIAVAAAGSNLYLAFRNVTTTGNAFVSWVVATASATMPQVASGTVMLANPPYTGTTAARLAVCATAGEQFWIAASYADTSNIYASVTAIDATAYTVTLAGTTPINIAQQGAQAHSCTISRVSSTTAVVAASYQGYGFVGSAPNVFFTKYQQIATSGSVVGPLREVPYGVLASKPFAAPNGRTYAWFCSYSGLLPDAGQSSLVCADLKTDDTVTTNLLVTPVAVTAPRIASPTSGLTLASDFANATTYGGAPASVVTNGTQVVSVAVTKPGSISSRAVDVISLESSPTRLSVELGNSLYTTGGIVSAYDGTLVSDASFITYPDSPQSVTHLAGSGALSNNGVYQYTVVAVWNNTHGETMRSAPSLPITVTLGAADNTVRFYAPGVAFTALPSVSNTPITYELHRTTNAGTVFYKVPEAKIYNVANTTTGPLQWDGTANPRGLLQFEDRAADSDLSGQPILYTQGGILSGVAPPGSQIIAAHKGRLFVADGKDVWFSTRSASGYLPRFNELLRLRVEDGGNITALASLDSVLVVFKAGSIYYVAGDGPDDTGGTGQEFGAPQRIATDLGCIEPRSVCLTPAGLTFQSSDGIYLLTRQLQVIYFSAPVRDAQDANPTITSAVVNQRWLQARLSANVSKTGATGTALVWDYTDAQTNPRGTWTTFQFFDTTASQASSAIASACTWQSAYCWLAPNGTVYQESASTWLDNGQWVTLQVETAWFKFAGLQGFQRVWGVGVLGSRGTDHNLTYEYAVDYSGTYEPAITKTVTSALPLEELRYEPRKQKCVSMRIRLTDASPTSGTVGSGQGLSITGLAFEVKSLANINRLPSANRT